MDKTRKSLVADFLFGVQILGAFVLCGAQFFRLLPMEPIRGVSVAQFCSVATYTLIHLALALGAHRILPSRTTRQVVATYCTWLVLILAIVGVIAWNGTYRWSIQDTITTLTAFGLTLVILGIGRRRHLTLAHPEIKAFLAIAYKSVPQVLLVWTIAIEGNRGIPAVSIIVGHVTILIRLVQIAFMVKEGGWDKNRIWLAVSETANELSWIAATAAWLMH